MRFGLARWIALGGALFGIAFAARTLPSCASLSDLDSDECIPSGAPGPPSGRSGGGPVVELALQNLNFGVTFTDAGSTVQGFDLDHACSREDGRPTSCASSPTASPHKDDGHGGDNALGWLIAANPYQFNELVVLGVDPRVTLLMRIRDYNGQANDDQVSVDIFTSGGLVPTSEGGAPGEPSGDASDTWTVSCENLVSCEASTPVSTGGASNAYVVDGVLVSGSTPGSLQAVTTASVMGAAAVPVHVALNDPILVVTLENDSDGGIRAAHGILAGRWATGDLIQSLLCTGVPTDVNDAEKLICPFADLPINHAIDGTGQPCNTLSTTMSFDAYPAHISNQIVPIPFPACDADATPSCP